MMGKVCQVCEKDNHAGNSHCGVCHTRLKNSKRQFEKIKTWMACAWQISDLATCNRLHVGAVIVNNNRVVSTGYNGAPSGFKHCDEVGHLIKDNHCLRVTHAESNCIIRAPQEDLGGATIYCTHRPCHRCFLLIAQAGINKIIFDEVYGNADCDYLELAHKNDILVGQLGDDSIELLTNEYKKESVKAAAKRAENFHD